MIFDTIYNFFFQLLVSNDDVSTLFSSPLYIVGAETTYVDYFAMLGTIVVICLGVVALFRILGGVLKLFKV